MIWNIVGIVAFVLFLIIAVSYNTEIAQHMDEWAQDTFGHNGFLEPFHVIGNTSTIINLALLFGFILIVFKKAWKSMLFTLCSVALANGFNKLLKRFFERPRPEIEDQLTSYSFPSGHTMGTTVLMLTIAYIINIEFFKTRPKKWLYAIAIIIVAFVALSRIAGFRHYLTDVCAAFFIGVAFVVLLTNIYKKITQ